MATVKTMMLAAGRAILVPSGIARFLIHQYRSTLWGGWPAARRKSALLILFPVAALLLLIIRGISPLFLFRFRPLSSRIGSLAPITELYLCEREMGLQQIRSIDIFFYEEPIPNSFLRQKLDGQLHTSFLARPINALNQRLPGGSRHCIPVPSDKDPYGLLEKSGPHFTFTDAENARGEKELLELGVPEGAPFVCFHARDPSYMDHFFGGRSANQHQDYRNASIYDALQAAEALTKQGYFVIRMGAVVQDKLNSANPLIIDYASGVRSDFMDIFLSTNCRFYFGSSSGVYTIPRIMRRPIALVNFIPADSQHFLTCAAGSLTILKKLWIRSENRLMTFRESIVSGVGRFNRSEQFDQLGVDIVDNSPEEITAVVQELDARLNGSWETTKEAEKLHQRFLNIFQMNEAPGALATRAELEKDVDRKWTWQRTVEDEELQRQLSARFPGERWGRIGTRIGAEFIQRHTELLN